MNWYQYILLELYGTNWLASKKCFLSSQGLVGVGMNCRVQHHLAIPPRVLMFSIPK